MDIESTKRFEISKPLQKPPAQSVTKTEQERECRRLSDDEHTALKQALSFSFFVYDPASHVKQELERLGYDNVEFQSRFYTGAQVVCCTKDDRAFIAFRGSASILDWLMDFLIIPFFWPLRHFGFQTTWLSVRNSVRKWLKKTPHENVLLCGHSLGGAMAHLAAWNLAKDYNIANVFTFGAPKACFASTARKLMDTKIQDDEKRSLGDIMYSVVNQRDIVAKVPFYSLGYRDVGNLVYIDHKGGVSVGEEAQRSRDEISMNDLEFVMQFLETENKVVTGLEVSAKDGVYYIKQGLFWIGQYAPQIRLVATVPLLYVLICLYFMRSSLNHMTEQYTDVFFRDFESVAFERKTPSKFGRALGKIKLTIIVLGSTLLFLWGLYEIVLWMYNNIEMGV